MGLVEAGVEVVKAVMPPKTNDLDAQQRWRWVVFVGLTGLTAALTVHILLACGLMPSMYAGFALASDQQMLQKRVDVIATLSLEHEMREKKAELCVEKDTRKRLQINDEIDKLNTEYHDITKEWYQVPGCDSV